MHKRMKPVAVGAGLTLLTGLGCYDFNAIYAQCVEEDRCTPPPIECVVGNEDVTGDFQDADCDGIDGTAALGVFVEKADKGGVDSPTGGSREEPFATVSYALDRLPPSKRFIFIAQGVYDEPELRITRPVTLLGAYSGKSDGWSRARGNITKIQGVGIGATVAVKGSDGPTLERLNITAMTSAQPGTPSIALRVVDTARVTLSHVQLLALAGAAGTAGTSGSNGAEGSNGSPGASNTSVSTQVRAKGGTPGSAPCGNSGGTGGFGADKTTPSTAGLVGTPDRAGGAGGADCGDAQATCSSGSKFCTCRAGAGSPGADGGAGGGGQGGAAGDITGAVIDNTWTVVSGRDGLPGFNGTSGGGGGGGGRAYLYNRTLAMGGGGGGGGAGGCGGQLGFGGQGGGASIALLLLRSQVELDACELVTAAGGAGGAGGQGGQGGRGGERGLAGTSFTNEEDVDLGTDRNTAVGGPGGNGGLGGAGGAGGAGGNGAGGPSVGIWCQEASVTVNDTRASQLTQFSLGSAGKNGDGPGNTPPAGLKQEQYGCTQAAP